MFHSPIVEFFVTERYIVNIIKQTIKKKIFASYFHIEFQLVIHFFYRKILDYFASNLPNLTHRISTKESLELITTYKLLSTKINKLNLKNPTWKTFNVHYKDKTFIVAHMFEQNNRMKVHQGEWKWKFNSTKIVPNNAISPNLEILESFKLYVPLLKKTNCSNIQNPNASKINFENIHNL